MEIADTPISKRHRHVSLTRGDRDDRILRHWHQPGSRIYRVSRASGGKDRHSKVYTAKGLRDRRVRLSVSTAIQFYDLQDRLGYDQPSKAIEWLIRAADSAIAELPSLGTMFPSSDEITLARPKEEMVIAHIADADRQSSASETSRGSNPRSSFTELLTGASAEYVPRVTPTTETEDYFPQLNGMAPFEMQQFDFLQQDHFFPLVAAGNNYSPNFSISSGIAGFHRGTLQSNSQSVQHVPFLFGTAASAATSAQEGRYPAGYDGHLDHLELLKGKGKG